MSELLVTHICEGCGRGFVWVNPAGDFIDRLGTSTRNECGGQIVSIEYASASAMELHKILECNAVLRSRRRKTSAHVTERPHSADTQASGVVVKEKE